MLQAFLVVPGFAAVYLLAAPTTLRRRLVQLLASGAALFASAAWWVAIVAVWPASSRPYIGGSQDEQHPRADLRVQRLRPDHRRRDRERRRWPGARDRHRRRPGRHVGADRPRRGSSAARWGPRSRGSSRPRSFSAALALWGLQAGAAHRRAARRSAPLGLLARRHRARLQPRPGDHPPVLQRRARPAIGALVGIGVVFAWARRDLVAYRLVLAATLAGTAIWAFVLLDRTPVLASGAALRGADRRHRRLGADRRGPTPLGREPRRRPAPSSSSQLAAALAAPAAYSAQTAATAHSGALPTAGPRLHRPVPGPAGAAASAPAGGAPPFAIGGGRGGLRRLAPQASHREGGVGRTGGLGGLLDASTPSKALVTLLRRDASSYRWVAAIVGANSAAGVQLATGEPVMAIGGFNGTDPSPSLAEFKADVAAGRIHYFVSSGGGFGGGGGLRRICRARGRSRAGSRRPSRRRPWGA